MMIKIFITDYSQGKFQVPRGLYHKAILTRSGKAGMSVDDPTFIDDECTKATETVILFSESHNIKYKIYNVNRDWLIFSSWIYGIKEYPTTIVGRKKIVGVPKIKDLEMLLS